MPVKVTIIDPKFVMFSIPTIEVEIPNTCPHCGADLTEAGCTIREAGFVWYSSPAYIDKAAPEHGRTEDAIECDGFEESFDETTLRVGYLCNECDSDLTTAPEDHPDKCHCKGTSCPGFACDNCELDPTAAKE